MSTRTKLIMQKAKMAFEESSGKSLSKDSGEPMEKQANDDFESFEDEDPFGDNSDLDPNFEPSCSGDARSVSEEESDMENHPGKGNTKQRKRVMKSKERLSRKRQKKPEEWTDNKAKSMLDQGKEHENRVGKKIRSRAMKEACQCRLKCADKINEEIRRSIFTDFWMIADHSRQWDFILRFVEETPKKQVTVRDKESRRQNSKTYYFKVDAKLQKVCKTMFLNTLDISETWITTAFSKVMGTGISKSDSRGKHHNRPNKIKDSIKDSVRSHIKMFPVVPSHYLRKDTKKMYFEPGLNIKKMYRLYLEHCDGENIVERASERQYRDIFNNEFNISFFKPKKDQCEKCSAYELADQAKKTQLAEDYDQHIKNKVLARNLKDADKELAVNSKDICVAAFDLQKVLATPKSDVSDFYYKSKYSTYNFTVYDLGNNEGHCYYWHERIAKRGSIEIESCLWKFLQFEKSKNCKEIIFYSDNCGGQNRNKFLFSMFSYASKTLEINITHSFLEKGHTQNEGDSMHSVIETAGSKCPVIYVPAQWIAIIRLAKTTGKMYIVTEMEQNDFFNFKSLTEKQNWSKDTSKGTVKISKIKEIQFKSAQPGFAFFKYDFDAENSNVLQIKAHMTRDQNIAVDLKRMYNEELPIDDKKLKGILWLCNNHKIPTTYHDFYKSLKSKKQKDDESEEEIEFDD